MSIRIHSGSDLLHVMLPRSSDRGFLYMPNYMSNDRRFCPTCKAMTMEPLMKEEYERFESGPFVCEGRLVPFECPICKHVEYEPMR